MSPEDINDIASWVLFSATVPFHTFLLVYGLGSPWYRSPLGRVMFGLVAALCLILDFALVRRIFGDFPGYAWVALAVYGLFSVVGWLLVGVLLKLKNETKTQPPITTNRKVLK